MCDFVEGGVRALKHVFFFFVEGFCSFVRMTASHEEQTSP